MKLNVMSPTEHNIVETLAAAIFEAEVSLAIERDQDSPYYRLVGVSEGARCYEQVPYEKLSHSLKTDYRQRAEEALFPKE